MNTFELKKYLQQNEPEVYHTHGKHLFNPRKLLKLISETFRWNFQVGRYEYNDMWSVSNRAFSQMFINALENSPEVFTELMDLFLASLKICYIEDKNKFDLSLLTNIIIEKKWEKQYDIYTFYTLIAGNFDEIYNLLKDYKPGKIVLLNNDAIKMLFDEIISNSFAKRLLRKYKNKIFVTKKYF
ncbi:MAG: hypothetical protein ACRC42_04535 [Mycoplasma sp.]